MILPPMNALKAFEAAARLSSLSRAGNELHVTHAAVSQQVRHLEDWLGRRLFKRAGRGLALTGAGEDFQRVVAPALLAVSTATTRLRGSRDRSAVTVGCIPSVATRWLVPALAEFLRRFPAIEVRVQYAQSEEKFDPERLNVLITTAEDHSHGISCTEIFSRINRPVASAHCVARMPHLLRPGGLEAADLLHDETVQSWADWFEKAGRRRTKPLRGPIYQDFNLLATAVIAGHGVALCPIEVFRREIANGDLVVLSDVATLEDRGYFLISEKPTDRAVAAFTDWFVGVCAPRRRDRKPNKPERSRVKAVLHSPHDVGNP